MKATHPVQTWIQRRKRKQRFFSCSIVLYCVVYPVLPFCSIGSTPITINLPLAFFNCLEVEGYRTSDSGFSRTRSREKSFCFDVNCVETVSSTYKIYRRRKPPPSLPLQILCCELSAHNNKRTLAPEQSASMTEPWPSKRDSPKLSTLSKLAEIIFRREWQKFPPAGNAC